MKLRIGAAVGLFAIAVASTALFLTSVESATINITLPAWKLESYATVHGAPTGGQFLTHRQLATLTETATGSATGVDGTGGTYATGYVVFHYACPSINPGCSPTPVQPGYAVCRATPGSGPLWCYYVQATVTCFCGESVPVRARGLGPGFNAPPNTVTTVTGYTYGVALTVTNPAPISGGTDATSQPIVKQSDIDVASASVRAQVTTDLLTALEVTNGVHVIPDGAPKITVTSSVAAGAHTKTFQVSATGTLGATEFQDSDAQALIAKGIDRWVPKGFQLNGAPVLTDFSIQDANEQGDVTVSGMATDYLLPSFSVDAIRVRLRGVSVDSARTMIETAAPGSHVDIRVNPSEAPILPLSGARIYFSITVRAAS